MVLSGIVLDRFLKRIRKLKNGCWQWMAATVPPGYGKAWDGERPRGTHILSYEYFCGPVPKGLCVLHDCDNPGCVNPAHLHLGTRTDNARERDERGRTAKGDRHRSKTCPECMRWKETHLYRRHPELIPHGMDLYNTKLTDADVRSIRVLLRRGWTLKRIGDKFGVRFQTISHIKCGKRRTRVK